MLGVKTILAIHRSPEELTAPYKRPGGSLSTPRPLGLQHEFGPSMSFPLADQPTATACTLQGRTGLPDPDISEEGRKRWPALGRNPLWSHSNLRINSCQACSDG